MQQRVVVTGGPGSGKTTLLSALAARGYTCMPESARIIIRERLGRGLPPRPDPAEFAREILRMDMANHRGVLAGANRVFFDRGVLDALGMLFELNLLTPSELQLYRSRYPYFRRGFCAPPWREIYATDQERDQSWDEAVHIHGAIRDWYARCGYELVELPRASVEERCEFVLRNLGVPGHAG